MIDGSEENVGDDDLDYIEEVEHSVIEEAIEELKEELIDRIKEEVKSKIEEEIKKWIREKYGEWIKKELRRRIENALAKRIGEKAAKKIAEKITKKILEKLAEKTVKEAAKETVRRASQRVVVQGGRMLAAQASKAIASLGAKAVAAIGGVSWPVVLIILIIIAVIAVLIYVVFLFLGAINGVSSLAGGSIFLPADYDNLEHRAIVENLIDKRDGNVRGHELRIYDAGKKDIEWKWEINEDTGEKEYFNILDIRLLKTLDYLTDKHEYIHVGMLKTNSPDYLYDEIRDKKNEEIIVAQKETVSALHTGQAMSIIEVDKSRILALPSRPPIQMFWQKTFAEAFTRPVWEEIAFDVGYLDKNIPVYQQILDQDEEYLNTMVERYESSAQTEDKRNIYREAFKKVDRILELLEERVFNVDSFLRKLSFSLIHTLDNRAFNYFKEARNSFKELQELIGDYEAADFDVTAAILALGSNTELIRDGAQNTYKATQVANMVNWNRKMSIGLLGKEECLSAEDCDDKFRWWKAYEARNKIRQVIKELLEMPRETSLGVENEEESEEEELITTEDFDKDLVVKQIITFSPEDDLDNGLGRLDIYPIGIDGVGVGGISFGTYGNDPESPDDPDQQAIGDGKVTYEDVHFSHMPIDNGVFSKIGTSYVYKNIEADDDWWDMAIHLIFKTPFSIFGINEFARNQIHDSFVGGCPADLKDISWWFDITECRRVSYRDFLFVAF